MDRRQSPRKYNWVVIPPNDEKTDVGLQDINDDKPFVVQRSTKPLSPIEKEKERLKRQFGGEVQIHGINADGSEFDV